MPDTILDWEKVKERIIPTLREILPWSSLDFIKGISVEGDKELACRDLSRNLSDEDDLRFIYRSNEEVEIIVCMERLPWDSSFFGYGVGRIKAVLPLDFSSYQDHGEYDALMQIIKTKARERGIQYLFTQVDPRDLTYQQALGTAGFSLIESRLYYHMELNNFSFPERYPVRLAKINDIGELGRTAQRMVNVYDRFHADPYIDRQDADRLMYKWMEASINEGFADAALVPDSPNPSAFCTVKYHKSNWPAWNLRVSQPVFSAVSPEYKGWYRKLISELNYHMIDIGAEHSYLITQVTNKAVVRVWESLGYRFGKAEHIMRIIL